MRELYFSGGTNLGCNNDTKLFSFPVCLKVVIIKGHFNCQCSYKNPIEVIGVKNESIRNYLIGVIWHD